MTEDNGGFGLALDGRPLRTPARVTLAVPHRALAEAIHEEWSNSGATVDPRTMPMTGLANAAIDRGDAEMAAGITRFAESDQFCYRAEDPPALVERQADAWDPLLDWARGRFAIEFVICSGINHVAQPPATIRTLSDQVATLDRFRLAALSPLVTIGASLIAGLAVLEGELPAQTGWDAISLDERWQLERWGSDSEAEAALDLKRQDFLAAARFIDLLG